LNDPLLITGTSLSALKPGIIRLEGNAARFAVVKQFGLRIGGNHDMVMPHCSIALGGETCLGDILTHNCYWNGDESIRHEYEYDVCHTCLADVFPEGGVKPEPVVLTVPLGILDV
jgi:hypothetical protein